MLQWIVVEPGSAALTPDPAPKAGEAETEVEAVAREMTLTSDIVGFKLEDLVIPVGTEVTWINQDSVSHTTTSGTPGELSDIWNSDFLSRGDSFSRVFLEAGSYPYFCRIHSSMTATITVMQPKR